MSAVLAKADLSDSGPSVSQRSARLSLVIPAFNEEQVIAQAVAEAVSALEQIAAEFEILVVDDGSRDATARIVADLQQRDQRVRLLRHPRNRGYGAALRTGFVAARFELVAFTDADCQFHVEDLGYLIDLTERFDVVSGYRIDRKDSSLRRFCSWGYNTLVQVLMGSPVRDIDCALKVFRREALLRILPRTDKFFANTEMFSRAAELQLRIVDVGVRHRQRAAGRSKVGPLDVPRTLDALLPFWWRIHFAGNRESQQPVTTEPRLNLVALCLLVLAGWLLLTNLSYPLIEPDEGRYAEIMREMAVTGDWLVPRLHQEHYLDKPPLFYWCGAMSIRLFGPEDWAVRLVPAACAWLTILLTWICGRQLLGQRSALLATIVLTLSVGFSLCGRYLILDSMLTLFVTGGLFLGALALQDRLNFRRGLWLVAAAMTGLGMLTKGPVALLLVVPPLTIWSWLRQDQRGLSRSAWVSFLGVVLLLNLPWYIAMAVTVPNFVTYFFWEHNLARFLTGSNHPAPAWFYAPILILGWMPWGGLLFPLVPFLASRSQKRREQRNPQVGLLALAACWCLLFFTLSSGKLPTYIVPCFPALALLIGHYLDCTRSPFALQKRELKKVKNLFYKAGLGVCLAGVGFPYVLWRLKLESAEFALAHGAIWAAGGLLFLLWQRQASARTVWWTYCALSVLVTCEASHHLFPAWAQRHALLPQESHVRGLLEDPTSRIACVQHAPGSIPFYLNRDDIVLLRWDQPRELERFAAGEAPLFMVADEHVDLLQLESQLPETRQLTLLSRGPHGSILQIVPRESPAQGSSVGQQVALAPTW